MGEEVVFGLLAPQPVVRRADAVERGEERVCLPLFREIGDGRHGHRDVRIDEPLAAGDRQEIQRRVRSGVESSDVRDHDFGVQDPFPDPIDAIHHVADEAAGVGRDVVHHVVDVVEVEGRGEFLVLRPREEVEAAVVGEQRRALREERRNRRHHEDVVVAVRRAGVGAERRHRVGECRGVHEVERHAVHVAVGAAVRPRETEHPRGAGEAGFIDVGHHEHSRAALRRMAGYIDQPQPHRAAAGHQQHRPAGPDALHMRVCRLLVVVVRPQPREDARKRLREGALEECVATVGEEAPHLHRDRRKPHVRGFAAGAAPREADHAVKLVARHVEGRLDADALPDAETAFPPLAHLADDAGHLVADHHRVRRDVVRDAPVARAKCHALVVAHADRVCHDLDNDAILAGRFKFDVLEAQVACAVKPQCLGFHFLTNDESRMEPYQRTTMVKASGVSVRSPGLRNSVGARAPALTRRSSMRPVKPVPTESVPSSILAAASQARPAGVARS